jgi:hypothetical protein
MTVPTFTASWKALWQASKTGNLAVTPTRISISPPRFWAGATRFPAVPDLMPWGLFTVTDRAEFEPQYRARLEEIGFERIAARLEAIAAECGGRPLALACYEDLSKTWCHRECASAFLEANGWGEVRELSQPAVQLRLEVPER